MIYSPPYAIPSQGQKSIFWWGNSTKNYCNKKNTLSAREIQSSVKLILPGELATHANLEGAKAVNNIAQSI